MTDLHRAVDLLVARPDVDARRLGYMGFSCGGGRRPDVIEGATHVAARP